MNILIVEEQPELGALWARHLSRFGAQVRLATSEQTAFQALREDAFAVVVLDLGLADNGAMSVSDFASYRQPDARIIFVTNATFFSDAAIFRHCANACAYVPSYTPPEDLAAIVEHYATRA
ncbi:response regulator [Pseudoprimorskyibacter insulae]|uniref:Response regulatory domain-containing protein n=1 Tax=Pseudoprimorskyibacter insulae TaxID=1695997 RepID=A0A2R8AUH4_9RHOB|nr:response regulator [Pseudoprimorskyibacter insulae]SPF79685.1 hypothetical protein PRI8871_01482 [Pseudoprimorskyibacter insulae]